ncbi:MAG: hypothetical protein H6765_00855 [Candidatus Peribacteria bacterium]|nr:MAG: hypothetical protein H6765_00855 [Candidatus Peribacteria bacterium]
MDRSGGQVMQIDATGQELGIKRYPLTQESIARSLATYIAMLLPSTILIKKSVLESVGGFDERRKFADDYSLYMQLLIQGYRVQNMSDILAYYRQYPDNTTHSSTFAKDLERLDIRHKYGKQLPGYLPGMLYNI